MTDDPTIMWPGISGNDYKYWISPVGSSFKSVPSNYIFATETSPNNWTAIYVGQTDNLDTRLSNHEKYPCILRHIGTHIHHHTSTYNTALRRKEESDIRDKWNPPCNSED